MAYLFTYYTLNYFSHCSNLSISLLFLSKNRDFNLQRRAVEVSRVQSLMVIETGGF